MQVVTIFYNWALSQLFKLFGFIKKVFVLNVHDPEILNFQWPSQRRPENDACAGLEELIVSTGLPDLANNY